MSHPYDIAAYIWPAYTGDEPRTRIFWPDGYGEWQTVRQAGPRFAGHTWPRRPLWGYVNEADPYVMQMQIDAAADHGVNVFIYDWYWYEGRPFLEQCLNNGFLRAANHRGLRFYLMWANHDVDTLWNMHEDTRWERPRATLWSGQVPRAAIESMFDRILDKYLSLECYYRIAGKPVFSIYEFQTLITGLGGVDAARDTLDWMRRRAVARGLPALDLQTTITGLGGVMPDGTLAPDSLAATAHALAFDSATSYQFCHTAGGTGDYVAWANRAIGTWPESERVYGTYYPHVSVGWDNTQRNPSAAAESVVVNATPDAFEACLWKAKAWLDARPHQTPLVTINSWNEWTEGSSLLPDMRWGYGYLRAVRQVFGEAFRQ